ncbi:MAG: helix-turn-helix transcriptional regulator [Paludibacter sp.]|nr:helix-turn-helix transcriptional regulator [Paludibacter sp.]
MQDLKQIHIGKEIEKKIAESGMTKTEIAHRINCERATINDICKRKSINIEQLLHLSNALNFDFIHEVYFKDEKQKNNRKVLITIELDEEHLSSLHFPKNIITQISTTLK